MPDEFLDTTNCDLIVTPFIDIISFVDHLLSVGKGNEILYQTVSDRIVLLSLLYFVIFYTEENVLFSQRVQICNRIFIGHDFPHTKKSNRLNIYKLPQQNSVGINDEAWCKIICLRT